MSEHEEPVDGEVVPPRTGAGARGGRRCSAGYPVPDARAQPAFLSRAGAAGGINPQEWGSTLEAVGKSGHGLIGLSYVDQAEPPVWSPGSFPKWVVWCACIVHPPGGSSRPVSRPGHQALSHSALA